jgi:hypothetical protein
VVQPSRQEIHSRLRAHADKLPMDLHGSDIVAVYELLQLAFIATNVYNGISYPQPVAIGEEAERTALERLQRHRYIDILKSRPLIRKGVLLGIILAEIAGETWDER